MNNAARIVNLTPHPINIVGGETIPASGIVARCEETTAPAGMLNGIPLVVKRFGAVVGLPDAVEGVVYIVSSLVRTALGNSRPDVLTVGETVRDDKGRIVGCTSLCVIEE